MTHGRKRPPARYELELAGRKIQFTEASGLDEAQRGGERGRSRKLPGLARFGNITLKRGVGTGPSDLQAWYEAAAGASQSAVIRLLDEGGRAIARWVLVASRPVKIEGPSLHAGANEIAIESLEIAAEGLQLVDGDEDDDDKP